MAFILKPSTSDSKGVVIFRHTERQSFFSKADSSPGLADAIEALKSRYVIGVHWGWVDTDVGRDAHSQFYLAGKGTMTKAPGNPTPLIPLCSRNFNAPYFRPYTACPKHWDIVSIANGVRWKRLDELLETFRLVLDERPDARLLIVAPIEEGPLDAKKWYTDIGADVSRLFSRKEREQLDVMRLLRHETYHPVSPETVAFLYQASRLFTLYSNREGNARVIHEALLCGLPVVAKRHLEGGGLDYLDESNSRLFSSVEEAARHFLDLLKEPLCFDSSALRSELVETYTMPKLVAALRQVFEGLGEPFHGDIDGENLAKKLPGHARLLPPEMIAPGAKIDELSEESHFLRFVDFACGTNLTDRHRFFDEPVDVPGPRSRDRKAFGTVWRRITMRLPG